MDAQVFGIEVWPVKHDIVREQELALGHDFEAQAKDMPSVNCIGIRVLDLESSDRAAYAIKTLLVICFLFVGFAQ